MAVVLGIATLSGGCTDRTQRAYAQAARAQALLDAGDIGGARAAMTRALQLRDDQVELQLLDARIKYRMNDVSGAFSAYSLALAIDPMNPEALQAVSQLGAVMGAQNESTAATERILTVDPNNAQALMIRGLDALGKRDVAKTQAVADQLLKLDPQSEPGLVLKARAETLAGHEAEALALLNGGLKRSGPTRMTVTALLETARDRGDAPLMLEQFRILGGLVPKNIDLTLDETNVRYKLGQLAQARARGWNLIAENGGDSRAMQRLIDLWAEYDPTPLEGPRLDRLAKGGAPAARLAAARFYLNRGDPATADRLLTGLGGVEADSLRLLVAARRGDPGAAGRAEAVLSRDTTNCDALAVRASAALARGRPGDAVVAAQTAAAECPDRDGYALLARAYGAKENEIATRTAFLEGGKARPLATEPTARYVAWLLARGDGQGAVNIARGLTQRAPAKISAWRLLAATCARARDAACAGDARAGEAKARRTFAIDLPPGERRPSPLLGNSWR